MDEFLYCCGEGLCNRANEFEGADGCLRLTGDKGGRLEDDACPEDGDIDVVLGSGADTGMVFI